MAPKARGSVVDHKGDKRAELQRERKTMTGPKRHGSNAAAEAENDLRTLREANTSMANLRTAASALKAAAAASDTPVERNERAWKKYRSVEPTVVDKSGVSQPACPRAFTTGDSGTAQHEDLSPLDGVWGGWTGEQTADNFGLGVIEGSRFYWLVDPPSKISVSRRGLLTAGDDRAEFRADGSLHWDDGAVWTRCKVEENDDMLRVWVDLPSSIQRHVCGAISSIMRAYLVRKDNLTADFYAAAKRVG